MKIPGFLFDNDGVLIDSRELHWLAWNTFSQEYNVPISYSTFIEGFGKRNDTFLRNLAPLSNSQQRQEWADRKEEIFRGQSKGKVQLLPGMEAFLYALQNEGYPRIIASSGTVENLKMFLTTTVLGKYFQDFISGEQVPHGKPSPDIFIEASHKLGLDTTDCIVIEDSPVGLEAGFNAGCFVIALATTHSKDSLKNHHLIFNSPMELDLKVILDSFSHWRTS